jgi:hypothetical protein
MILPQSSTHISKLKDEGAAKRQRLLKLMPDEFTTAQLALVSCITNAAAMAQIQKMIRWREVEPTSAYKKPRTYRKLSVDNSHTV